MRSTGPFPALYCLNCGYDLHGLSGDPITCPECAFNNQVAKRRAQFRELERCVETRVRRSLSWCLAAGLASLLSAVVGFFVSTLGYWVALLGLGVWAFHVRQLLQWNRFTPPAIVTLISAHFLAVFSGLAGLLTLFLPSLFAMSIAIIMTDSFEVRTREVLLAVLAGLLFLLFLVFVLRPILSSFRRRLRRFGDALLPLRPPPWREIGRSPPRLPPSRA